jgi:hypothetical protein
LEEKEWGEEWDSWRNQSHTTSLENSPTSSAAGELPVPVEVPEFPVLPEPPLALEFVSCDNDSTL